MAFRTPPQPVPWPFRDPENVATFTTIHVLNGAPILRIYRGYLDGAWQFHYFHEPAIEDARLVALSEIWRRDRSIGLLADLPDGWMAQREFVGSPWQRKKNHSFATFEESGYYLINIAAILQEHPNYIEVPPAEDMDALEPGDLVKVIFRFAAEDAPHKDLQCERMWVEIEGIEEDGYFTGSLANDPELTTVIKYEHKVVFAAEHVIAIESNDPEE